MKIRKLLIGLLAAALALAIPGAAGAKSAYVVANHHTGAFDAWNINPDGTLTYQTTHGLAATPDPSGVAVYEGVNSAGQPVEVIFLTSEFSNTIELVDATTMTSLGLATTQCPLDLSGGIAVDSAKNRVYASVRNTNILLVFSFDPDALTLTCHADNPTITLPNAAGVWDLTLDDFHDLLYVSDGVGGRILGYDVSNCALGAGNCVIGNPVFTHVPSQVPVGIGIDRFRQKLYSTAPDGSCAFAPAGTRDVLLQIDIATGAETEVPLGNGGMGIATDENTGNIYVTGGCSGDNISVWGPTLTAVQNTGSIGNPAGITIGKAAFNPLHLIKDDHKETIPSRSLNRYDICYDNLDGATSMTNTVLVDDLPPGTIFVSASHGGVYHAATRSITWNLGTLPPGTPQQCVQFQVIVVASPGAILTNYATIDTDQIPPTTVDDTTEVTPAHILPFAPVPAISLWGLTGLTGLLLAIGLVSVRQRKPRG